MAEQEVVDLSGNDSDMDELMAFPGAGNHGRPSPVDKGKKPLLLEPARPSGQGASGAPSGLSLTGTPSCECTISRQDLKLFLKQRFNHLPDDLADFADLYRCPKEGCQGQLRRQGVKELFTAEQWLQVDRALHAAAHRAAEAVHGAQHVDAAVKAATASSKEAHELARAALGLPTATARRPEPEPAAAARGGGRGRGGARGSPGQGGHAVGRSGRGHGQGAAKTPSGSGRGRGTAGRGKKRARSDTPDPRSKLADEGHSQKPSGVEVPAGSPESKKPALGGANAASPSPRAARSRSRAAAAQASEAASAAGPSASPEVVDLAGGCHAATSSAAAAGAAAAMAQPELPDLKFAWKGSRQRCPGCTAGGIMHPTEGMLQTGGGSYPLQKLLRKVLTGAVPKRVEQRREAAREILQGSTHVCLNCVGRLRAGTGCFVSGPKQPGRAPSPIDLTLQPSNGVITGSSSSASTSDSSVAAAQQLAALCSCIDDIAGLQTGDLALQRPGKGTAKGKGKRKVQAKAGAGTGYGGGHSSSAFFGGLPLPPPLHMPLPASLPAAGALPNFLLEGIPHFNWDSHSSDEDDLNSGAEEHAAWQEAMYAPLNGAHKSPQEGHNPDRFKEEAEAAQSLSDLCLQRRLQHLRVALEELTGNDSVALMGLPLSVCGLMFGSTLARSLRWLLQNDSMQDICRRSGIFLEVFGLMRCLGSNIDLVQLLTMPADFEPSQGPQSLETLKPEPASSRAEAAPLAAPRPAPSPGRGRGRGRESRGRGSRGRQQAPPPPAEAPPPVAATPCAAEAVPSVLDALEGLKTRAGVFKRCAEHMGESQADIESLSVLLGVETVHEELHSAVEMWRSCDSRGCQQKGTVEPLQSPSATDLPARYRSQLKPLQYREGALLNAASGFYFRKQATQKAPGGDLMRKWLKRVTSEHANLSTSLPLAWESAICLVADAEKLSCMRALMFGPSGTPYSLGCFVFDIWLADTYPSGPPLVQFLTTGGGKARFNPNLYECGKVCLSLLGTWSGPGWDPVESTLLQVLVSILSMVFVEEPYFNEPGYESSRNSEHGKRAAEAYDQQIRLYTMQHAILPALQKPSKLLEDAIRLHFVCKKSELLAQCDAWEKKATGAFKSPMRTVANKIRAELKKLSTE